MTPITMSRHHQQQAPAKGVVKVMDAIQFRRQEIWFSQHEAFGEHFPSCRLCLPDVHTWPWTGTEPQNIC